VKTKVLITIDTEFSSHKGDIGVFGTIRGKSYGLPLIMELANKHNIKFTFFVDVYGVRKQFKASLISICKELLAEGHDLQLHTHPGMLFDKNRNCLYMYSLEEQVQIIKKGNELFKEWFGISPAAHRAGDWSANDDTIKALFINNIKIDSSGFFRYEHCRLIKNNYLINHGDITEIPPSTYRINGLNLFKDAKLLSTDGNPLQEVFYVLNEMLKDHRQIINIVYHSFSFLQWNKRRTEYRFSMHRKEKFERLLEFISGNCNLEPAVIKELNLEKYTRQSANEISTGLVYFIPRLADKLKTIMSTKKE